MGRGVDRCKRDTGNLNGYDKARMIEGLVLPKSGNSMKKRPKQEIWLKNIA